MGLPINSILELQKEVKDVKNLAYLADQFTTAEREKSTTDNLTLLATTAADIEINGVKPPAIPMGQQLALVANQVSQAIVPFTPKNGPYIPCRKRRRSDHSLFSDGSGGSFPSLNSISPSPEERIKTGIQKLSRTMFEIANTVEGVYGPDACNVVELLADTPKFRDSQYLGVTQQPIKSIARKIHTSFNIFRKEVAAGHLLALNTLKSEFLSIRFLLDDIEPSRVANMPGVNVLLAASRGVSPSSSEFSPDTPLALKPVKKPFNRKSRALFPVEELASADEKPLPDDTITQ